MIFKNLLLYRIRVETKNGKRVGIITFPASIKPFFADSFAILGFKINKIRIPIDIILGINFLHIFTAEFKKPPQKYNYELLRKRIHILI